MLRSYVRPYERSISTRHHYRKAAFTGGLRFLRRMQFAACAAVALHHRNALAFERGVSLR